MIQQASDLLRPPTIPTRIGSREGFSDQRHGFELALQAYASTPMRLCDVALVRVAQDPAAVAELIPDVSARGCRGVPLSPAPEAGPGAIAAGGDGVTEVPTRNPVDTRKIAADNKNSMIFA